MTDVLIDTLSRLPHGLKAEIVGNEIRIMNPTGDMLGRAALKIVVSLTLHEGKAPGRAYPDNVGFIVDLPSRRSFSPDAAWYIGPSSGMKFLRGAPAFAVEVRSEGDYGDAAEREITEKRADYFAAGTLVVWDVDLLSDDVVRVYRSTDPDNPTIYHRGEIAEAEPAVPGWRMAVDDLFV